MNWAKRVCLLLLVFAGAAASTWAASPVVVSPGGVERLLVAPSGCPTFSWGAPPAGRSLELLVYPLEADRTPAAAPVLRERLPAGATAWTPSVDRCLAPGEYAWSIRVAGEADVRDGGETRFFAVSRDLRDELRDLAERVQELQTLRQEVPRGAATATGARSVAPSPFSPAEEGFTLPPTCNDVFTDVPASNPFCPYVELAYADELTGACAAGSFCPRNAVTREQLALALERTRHASAGGVLTGNYPDPGLAPAYELPQTCGAGQFVRWNGTGWFCGGMCGDGDVDFAAGEVCDDGNTITEADCPYGTPACSQCDATCTSLVQRTGSFCGDGVIAAQENCDDGNDSDCGTCSADCKTVQHGRAAGTIYAVGNSLLQDGEVFILDDNFGMQVWFEFDFDNSVQPGNVKVSVAGLTTDYQVSSAIAAAINNVSFLIDAQTAPGGTVTLLHQRYSELANTPPIYETVADTHFVIAGMAGGQGGNCSPGTTCTSGDDCASGSCTGGTCN